jgi:hypothetical protein
MRQRLLASPVCDSAGMVRAMEEFYRRLTEC